MVLDIVQLEGETEFLDQLVGETSLKATWIILVYFENPNIFRFGEFSSSNAEFADDDEDSSEDPHKESEEETGDVVEVQRYMVLF